MSDRILLRHILEGLIHNLNNPLNMVLGYSQRIKAEYPDIAAADKIYNAGIKIDDTLKQLADQLWKNSFNLSEDFVLNRWLDGELAYLQHHLPLKHRFVITRVDEVDDLNIRFSPLQIAVWFENALAILCEILPENFGNLGTGVCFHESRPALYIRPDDAFKASPSFIESLLQANCNRIGSKSITTLWDNATLYGICQ